MFLKECLTHTIVLTEDEFSELYHDLADFFDPDPLSAKWEGEERDEDTFPALRQLLELLSREDSSRSRFLWS